MEHLYHVVHEHHYGQSNYYVKVNRELREEDREFLSDVLAIEFEQNRNETIRWEKIEFTKLKLA